MSGAKIISAMTTNPAAGSWRKVVSTYMYNHSNFNKIGLYNDDTITQPPTVITEALRRYSMCDNKGYNERLYRITIATHLSRNKSILPMEEWTKMENDVPYLQPYIVQVKREMKEKADWNKQ